MAAPSQPDAALAQTLRALRVQRGITQEHLAHAATITTGALARIELGRANPTWTTVRSIIGAMDVSLLELAEHVQRAASE